MVKCSALLLSVSIFLFIVTLITTPVTGLTRQTVQADIQHASIDSDSPIPIHRVILLLDPVRALSDPLVLSLHTKTLAQRDEHKRKHSFPHPKLPGDTNVAPIFALPGKPANKSVVDAAESINVEQLTALADLYLTDAIKDRLVSRYRITVLDFKEVNNAIRQLGLSRDQTENPEGAQKLCTRLEGDAVVVIGAPVLTMREGPTRDLVLRAEVRIAALRDPNGGFMLARKPHPLSGSEGSTHTKPQVDFTVAGAAIGYRAFLRSGYSSDYAALSEQAAAQAAAIALHTLSTGEQAPLLGVGERVAIAPAFGPDRADALIFSSSGRHTVINAIKQLPTDVSSLFRPDLLPVLTNEITDAL